jgi:succinyl-CoA synthetase alpha subunit
MMVVLGELGGGDEYSLVEALKQGKVNKLVIAWVMELVHDSLNQKYNLVIMYVVAQIYCR